MRLKPLTRQTFKSASVAVPLLACMHMAHGEGPAATAAGPEWLLLASPFVWAPSMHGQAALGGVNSRVDVPFSEVVHNLSSVFMGNLELTNRTLGFYLDGVYAKTDQSERVYGRKVGLAITQTTLAGGVYYRVYEHALGAQRSFPSRAPGAWNPLSACAGPSSRQSWTSTPWGSVSAKKPSGRIHLWACALRST